jgi:TRAP-type transport system small permease protein
LGDGFSFFRKVWDMPKFSLLQKAYVGFNKVVEAISVAILVLVTVVVVYSVLLRYVFQRPLAWSEEVARYMFIWLVFLGFSVAERGGDHFRIEVFVEMVPARIRIFIEVFLNVLIFYALYVFLREGLNYYEQGKRGLSTALEMPLHYIYVAVPVAVILTILNRIETVRVTLAKLVRQIHSEKDLKGVGEGVASK